MGAKNVIKMFFVQILLVIVAQFIISFLGNSIILSICNAIFGSDENRGWHVATIFTRICLPAIVFLVVYWLKSRDLESKQLYMKKMEGKDYQKKQDFFDILHDKFFYAECVIFGLLFLFIFIITSSPKWMFLAAIPLFFILNLLCISHLHKIWLSSRIRK